MTGEMLADAVKQIDPPLLCQSALTVLIEHLSGIVRKGRGRPKRHGVTARSLAKALRDIDHQDVDPRLLSAIVDHLEARRPLFEVERSARAHKRSEQSRKIMLLRGLFRDSADLDLSGAVITHPIVGAIKRPVFQPDYTNRQKLLLITQAFGRNLTLHPPSLGSMQNLVRGIRSRA